jgi:hypothetical protein
MVDGTADMVPAFMAVGTGRGMAAAATAAADVAVAIGVSAIIAVGHGDPRAWFCPTNGTWEDDSLSAPIRR